jgi:hypothetical protein
VDLVKQSSALFGVREVHPSTMGTWLRRLRLTKMTARPFHPKKDKAAQEEFKKNFRSIVEEALPDDVKEKETPIEFWFQDEARVGQQGTLSRVWSPIGSRPAMVRDNRRANAYIYGAICPCRRIGAALVMGTANTEAMNEHLKTIRAQVASGAHAVLICDGAGWHAKSKEIVVPSNITLVTLPPYSLNSTRWKMSGSSSAPTDSVPRSGSHTETSFAPAATHGIGSRPTLSVSHLSEPVNG